MASRNQQVLEPLAKLVKRGLRREKVKVEGGLDDVLTRVAQGQTEALADLPRELRTAVCAQIADAVESMYGESSAVKEASEKLRTGKYGEGIQMLFDATPVRGEGMPIYDSRFFARDPAKVAKDLCGSVMLCTDETYAWPGLVTETGGYRGSTPKDKETAESVPGTIGAWSTQGQKVLIVSAHEPDKKGTVAVWGMHVKDEQWPMGKVGEYLGIVDRVGERINAGSGLCVLPRDPSTDKVGLLSVQSKGRQKGAAASYKLVK